MDFVSGFPKFVVDSNVVWMIINRLIKSTCFLPSKLLSP